MMQFDMSKKLGQELENIFQCMYDGKCAYGIAVCRLIVIWKELTKVGMMTNDTLKKLETLFAEKMEFNFYMINSCNSAEISLTSREGYRTDCFNLKDYIELIVNEMVQDPILAGLLKGRNSYAGVIDLLDRFKEFEKIEKDNKKAEDVIESCEYYVIWNDHLIYVTEDRTALKMLPYRTVGAELPFSVVPDAGEILASDLLEGYIYSASDDKIAVNLKDDRFVVINLVTGKKKLYEGEIMYVIYDKALFWTSDSGFGVINVRTGQDKLIAENASVQVVCDDGNGLYWNLLEGNEQILESHYYNVRTGRDKVQACKKNVWQRLVNLLYEINMEYRNYVSSRLICYEIFEQVPMPFTVKAIVEKLASIERYGYNGSIIHSDDYLEVMGYLLSLDGSQCSETKLAGKLYDYIEGLSYTRDFNEDDLFFRGNVDYCAIMCKSLRKDKSETDSWNLRSMLPNGLIRSERESERERERERGMKLWMSMLEKFERYGEELINEDIP